MTSNSETELEVLCAAMLEDELRDEINALKTAMIINTLEAAMVDALRILQTVPMETNQ